MWRKILCCNYVVGFVYVCGSGYEVFFCTERGEAVSLTLMHMLNHSNHYTHSYRVPIAVEICQKIIRHPWVKAKCAYQYRNSGKAAQQMKDEMVSYSEADKKYEM